MITGAKKDRPTANAVNNRAQQKTLLEFGVTPVSFELVRAHGLALRRRRRAAVARGQGSPRLLLHGGHRDLAPCQVVHYKVR